MNKTVAIFETNPPSPLFDDKPAHGSWFEKILTLLKPDLSVVTYRVAQDEFPKTLDGIDGLIITGSSKEVYDEDSWITKAAKWASLAREMKIPTLGVCFGSQLLAEVAGGKVTKNPNGRENGTCTVKLVHSASSDPLFAGLPKNLSVQESHQSSIVDLPRDTTVLAQNDYGVQAFRINGESTWGVQFHPEVAPETLQKVIIFRKDILEKEGINPVAIRAGIHPTPEAQSIIGKFIDVVYEN